VSAAAAAVAAVTCVKTDVIDIATQPQPNAPPAALPEGNTGVPVQPPVVVTTSTVTTNSAPNAVVNEAVDFQFVNTLNNQSH